MAKGNRKITHAAHIKSNTMGTSNEISFSVLDAAKNAMDDGSSSPRVPRFGAISLFTLPGKKKALATPKKEHGLHLPGGGFVSAENAGAAPASSAPALGEIKAQGGSSADSLSGLGASSKGLSLQNGTVPGASWTVPAGEVARKKHARKRRKFLATGMAFAVTVAVIGAFGYWLYTNHLIYQDHLAQLNRAITLVTEADEVILRMDEAVVPLAMDSPSPVLTDEQKAAVDDVRSALPDAQLKLQNAEAFAKGALAGLTDSTDMEASNQIISTIEARQSMVEPALALMDDAAAVTNAVYFASEGWDAILRADALAREAAALLFNPTADNLALSLSKTEEALSLFQTASTEFSRAQDAYSQASFEAYQTYLSKRMEAMEYAVLSNQALIERDKEEAIAQNDAYSIADAEAAALADHLPADPAEVVKEASAEATRQTREAYSDARLQAGTSDAFLRDYLGSKE